MAVSKKQLQSEETITKLIDVATDVFAENGFTNTSLQQVCKNANVTRGALYHHFADKQDLFKAVFNSFLRHLSTRIELVTSKEDDPWAELVSGCMLFMETCTDARFQQIVMVDGPAVLDWNQYIGAGRNDPGGTHQALIDILKVLKEMGIIKPMPVEALAAQLAGAMERAARVILNSDNPQRELADAKISLGFLLEGLKQ
jgi:AcrR family transcriptional regulator